MKHKPLSLARVSALAVALTAALALAGCGKGNHAAPAEKQKTAAKPGEAAKDDHGKKDEHGHEEGQGIKLSAEDLKLGGITVEPLVLQEVRDQLIVTATIQANQDRYARISPRVPGRVVSVSGNLGAKVGAGQSLATLDSIEVGEARSAHTQAESEARVAKAALDRAERLQAEQIVSQKDYQRAKAENDKAQAALRAAADKLQMLGVGGGREGGVSVFALTAPFSGTIVEKKAVIGELAQPDKALFGIADLSVLWIEANLLEKDVSRVKVGDEASVTVDAYPKDVFTGKLTYVGGILDKESRTIRGRIEVKNADGRLKPEMFATAAIKTSGSTKALVVPNDAVVLVAAQPTVFVEERGGFLPRTVELGARLQNRVIVKSGLKEDDLVVVSGVYALKARMLKSQIGEGHAH